MAVDGLQILDRREIVGERLGDEVVRRRVAVLQNFGEVVLESEIPVLVDFWAAWCGPCRAVAPILDQIASEQSGKLVIAKLNVDENPDIASRYSISSIPAMKVFENGEIVREILGAMPKSQIERHLEGLL